ncbi:putative TetR-family transcriptional regulator [Actinoplanes missouriensis 431]|uniref:Putative TetR-family transcriptional regulator n=1 Tax=Actinoplanes missouriensis (strain ATCC 14538 / DSM 43046 / CBS 188.64 / JCM 3121 / NBRC 102363 / NCIMB 12654 / NRRL B-3342 / UNCC 431) TaxID=512565 RepID=I0H0J6_ACTM4|nr:TetR/AcrR family transcriptional regulator [Actinoplanes missouriensis]BAL86533.1 putative TetR-family transcriptional regulator [Actinoplanes missouriensis 431]
MDDKRRLILDQALALVDERGLAAMSMRAVAERVGLTSMALYPYVGGKDALLDGLVDLLNLELGTAVGDDLADIDWRRRLRALGRAVRALAHAHPSAYPLLLNRSATGASASWLTAALHGILHDAGVPAAEVSRMARMICAFLLGYTTGEVTGGLPDTERSAEPDAEFDADLADLVALIELAAAGSAAVRSGGGSGTPSQPGRPGSPAGPRR